MERIPTPTFSPPTLLPPISRPCIPILTPLHKRLINNGILLLPKHPLPNHNRTWVSHRFLRPFQTDCRGYNRMPPLQTLLHSGSYLILMPFSRSSPPYPLIRRSVTTPSLLFVDKSGSRTTWNVHPSDTRAVEAPTTPARSPLIILMTQPLR